MFEALRRMIFPIIIVTLLVFVAMIVLEWGLSFSSSAQYGNPNYVAVINGEEVSWQSFHAVYNQLYRQESQQREGDVPEQVARELEDQAFNQLLHDHLLMQQVEQKNISVTDEEIYSYLKLTPPQYVRQIPEFHTDGQFDPNKYYQFMANPESTPFWLQVEPMARQDLLKLKVQEMVIQAAMVTEDEVRQAFVADNETVTLGVANVPYNSMMQPPPELTEEELRAYYDEHIDDFTVGEQAVLKVAMIEKTASEADVESARLEIQDIYDSLMAGGDFAEMAEARSEDPQSAVNGGDLGWFPQGQMVPEFDERAFSMEEGEISEPFRTSFGWHIIKHHGYRTQSQSAQTESIDVRQAHVSHILLRVQPSAETLDKAFADLTEFRTLAETEGFDVAAEATGIEVKETRPFVEGQAADLLGPDPDANSFAFNNEPGTISGVRENRSVYYVAQVKEHLPAGATPFAEARGQVEAELTREIVRERCWDKANEVYELVEGGATLKEAASNAGATYKQTSSITRNGYIEGVGRQPEVIGAAFALTSTGDVSEPIEWSGGGTVLELLKREAPDLTLFNEKKDSIYTAVKTA
ncbi:hypothetical protein GF420_10890, partial [candidate division GN15 bacterium]|nr:hypothetical protein [candidate division GN15 bacterium]